MSRNMCARPVAVLAVMVCLCIAGRSQGVDCTVKGELHGGDPRMYSEYLIELVDLSHRSPAGRVDTHSGGNFEIRNVPSGEYSLVVTTLHGDLVHEQRVSICSSCGLLVVRIPEAPVKSPGANKTISVKQLLHPPTKKALRSFVEAQRFSESGDYPKAAEALERALQESPEYAEARVNLGAQYVRMGRFDAAVSELNRAAAIAGPSAVVYCNLASAQARLGKHPEAIESARSALRLDQSWVQAHLILGALLANDPRTKGEAIVHLERAAEQYESARHLLQRLRGTSASVSPVP